MRSYKSHQRFKSMGQHTTMQGKVPPERGTGVPRGAYLVDILQQSPPVRRLLLLKDFLMRRLIQVLIEKEEETLQEFPI
jgi:hypothetical protein